jgi:hypothetical protein
MKIAQWLSLMLVSFALTACASAPNSPPERASSEPSESGLFLGQFAFAERTQTAKGEHMVIGVFQFLEADLVAYQQLKFPVVASRTGSQFFSVGVVFAKEHLESAVKLEQEYGAIAPYILVEGKPERTLEIRGLQVVRMQVDDAWNLDAVAVRVAANKRLQPTLTNPRAAEARR